MNLKTKKIILLIFTILVLIINLSYAISIYFGDIDIENSDTIIYVSNNSQATLLFICALINFIAVFFICKSPLRHKTKLIILNVAQLLIGNIFNIIFGIVNIVILTRRTNDIEEEPKEKKELPILEDITKYKWYVYLMIFAFLFILCYTPLSDYFPIPDTKTSKIIAVVTLYIIQLILLVIPMWNELKRDFIVFKNNFKLYLGKMLPQFGVIAIFYLISSFSVMFLATNISTNQAIISNWPIYITAFVAILVAPIIEELMFRGFIRKFIKNDILFVLISSFVFGGLHVTSADSLQQFLYIIPYSILGLAFSLNYVKTKNIASNIFLHSAWNSIAVIGMILLKFLAV